MPDFQLFDVHKLTAKLFFIFHDVSIGIRTNEPSVLGLVTDYFPVAGDIFSEIPHSFVDAHSFVDEWFSIVAISIRGGKSKLYQLYQNRERIEEGFQLKRILNSMDAKIRLRISRCSKDKLFIHAGAVGWRNRGIIIPGRSGTGKTNLVAALVKSGATYYSDEYAVLDAQGFLYPYARPLSFREGSGERVRWCPVAELGGCQGKEPLQVGITIHTCYRNGGQWKPSVLSSGEAALDLLGNTLIVRERPAFVLSVLARAVSNVTPLKGDRGEAKTTASAIIDYVDRIELHRSIQESHHESNRP